MKYINLINNNFYIFDNRFELINSNINLIKIKGSNLFKEKIYENIGILINYNYLNFNIYKINLIKNITKKKQSIVLNKYEFKKIANYKFNKNYELDQCKYIIPFNILKMLYNKYYHIIIKDIKKNINTQIEIEKAKLLIEYKKYHSKNFNFNMNYLTDNQMFHFLLLQQKYR